MKTQELTRTKSAPYPLTLNTTLGTHHPATLHTAIFHVHRRLLINIKNRHSQTRLRHKPEFPTKKPHRAHHPLWPICDAGDASEVSTPCARCLPCLICSSTILRFTQHRVGKPALSKISSSRALTRNVLTSRALYRLYPSNLKIRKRVTPQLNFLLKPSACRGKSKSACRR